MININSDFKRIIKLWMPPVFLNAYRQLRKYGSADTPKRQFNLPTVVLDDLFPGIWPVMINMDGAVLNGADIMALPMAELFTIVAICQFNKPKKIFEFGTYAGLSALVMAMNTEEKARVYTLDIDPADRDSHEHGTGVGGFIPFEVGSYYKNTSYEYKIKQLFGNSATFDYSEYKETSDLVFVDADHSYRFASIDTENAFKLVSPGGSIVWDDYIWNEEHPECSGVARCLHELQQTRKIYHIAGTRLAIYLNNT